MPFTVACAQMAPRKAEVQANLDTIAETILQASSQEADLVVFPEACTTGYFLEGGVLESSLTEEQLCDELQVRLKSLNREVDAVIGFYQQDEGNLYNAASYFELRPSTGVKSLKTYRKFFLPTYGFFDEERFVSRGRDLAVFDTRFGRTAILICEDTWHSILPALSAVNGAQMLIVPAASPGRGFSGETIGNLDRYVRLLAGIAEEHGMFCINAQLCGFEGGKGFIGGSMVMDPFGKLLARGPINEEYLLIASIDPDLVQIARAQNSLATDLQSAWGDIKRIVDES